MLWHLPLTALFLRLLGVLGVIEGNVVGDKAPVGEVDKCQETCHTECGGCWHTVGAWHVWKV